MVNRRSRRLLCKPSSLTSTLTHVSFSSRSLLQTIFKTDSRRSLYSATSLPPTSTPSRQAGGTSLSRQLLATQLKRPRRRRPSSAPSAILRTMKDDREGPEPRFLVQRVPLASIHSLVGLDLTVTSSFSDFEVRGRLERIEVNVQPPGIILKPRYHLVKQKGRPQESIPAPRYLPSAQATPNASSSIYLSARKGRRQEQPFLQAADPSAFLQPPRAPNFRIFPPIAQPPPAVHCLHSLLPSLSFFKQDRDSLNFAVSATQEGAEDLASEVDRPAKRARTSNASLSDPSSSHQGPSFHLMSLSWSKITTIASCASP